MYPPWNIYANPKEQQKDAANKTMIKKISVPNSFPIWATIITFIGIAILLSLGIWQINRLQWKQQLLNHIEKQYNQPATLIDLEAITKESQPLRGIITGQLNKKNILKLRGRPFPLKDNKNIPFAQSGLYILAPVTTDGALVWVNLGWTQEDFSPEKEKWPDTIMNITGLLRTPPHIPFMPKNQPEQNKWYQINLDEFSNHTTGATKADHVYYMDAETSIHPAIIPISKKPELNNNHKQYACFWFGMAAILTTIYFIRFWKKNNII